MGNERKFEIKPVEKIDSKTIRITKIITTTETMEVKLSVLMQDVENLQKARQHTIDQHNKVIAGIDEQILSIQTRIQEAKNMGVEEDPEIKNSGG